MTALILSTAAARKFFFPAGFFCKSDPGEQLLAIGYLPVQGRGLAAGPAGRTINKHPDNGCSPEVKGDTVVLRRGVSRLDSQNFRVPVRPGDSNRDLPALRSCQPAHLFAGHVRAGAGIPFESQGTGAVRLVMIPGRCKPVFCYQGIQPGSDFSMVLEYFWGIDPALHRDDKLAVAGDMSPAGPDSSSGLSHQQSGPGCSPASRHHTGPAGE